MTNQGASIRGRIGGGPTPSTMPAAAWALAWSFLIGQVLLLGDRGLSRSDDDWAILSMLVGGLLVGWGAAGVLRARTGRLVMAWVLLVLSVLGYGMAAIAVAPGDGTGWSIAHLAASLAQVAALAWFSSTDYFAWQRRRPAAQGPALGSLIAIAAVVGILGGMTGPPNDSVNVQIRVSHR